MRPRALGPAYRPAPNQVRQRELVRARRQVPGPAGRRGPALGDRQRLVAGQGWVGCRLPGGPAGRTATSLTGRTALGRGPGGRGVPPGRYSRLASADSVHHRGDWPTLRADSAAGGSVGCSPSGSGSCGLRPGGGFQLSDIDTPHETLLAEAVNVLQLTLLSVVKPRPVQYRWLARAPWSRGPPRLFSSPVWAWT